MKGEIDLTAAVEAGRATNDFSWIDEIVTGPEAEAIRTSLRIAIAVGIRAAAPIIERAVREDCEAASKEVRDALLSALREFRDAIAPPLAPDHEVQSWPLCTPEQEFGGGVWCADDGCPLMAENSEIGEFREGTFTLAALHEAIAAHISARRDREQDDGWGTMNGDI